MAKSWSKESGFGFDRRLRFLFATLMLWLIGYCVSMMVDVLHGDEAESRFAWAFATFGIYLMIQSGLLLWLTGMLFKQHGLRKSRYSIKALMVVTTMAAMPLGFASVFQRIATYASNVKIDNLTMSGEPGLWITIMTIALFFAVIPLLMVCEALMMWFSKLRRKQATQRR